MSFGAVEFDAVYESTKNMYGTVKPDLTVCAKGLVASFKVGADKIVDGSDAFCGAEDNHYEAAPAKTEITLLSGEHFTVPFSYDEVNQMLAKARKVEDGSIDFRAGNWDALRKGLGGPAAG